MIKMVSNKLASALNEVGYNGDIKTENIENTIYEATKNKTRVVITGTEKRNRKAATRRKTQSLRSTEKGDHRRTGTAGGRPFFIDGTL